MATETLDIGIQEAAARLRSLPSDGELVADYAINAMLGDLSTIARAYLAEHPADELDAVTGDWLESIGFEYDDELEGWYVFKRHEGQSLPLVWKKEDGEHDWEFAGLPFDAKTRGDSRRLFTVLGIKLTPQTV